MIRSIALVPLLAVGLSGAIAGQPDRAAAMEKAKAKFEKDIAKLEDSLLAGIDKSIAKAQSANNKVLHEKLTYDRDMYVQMRLAPITFSGETYLRQRNQSIAALQAVYQPAINELTKAKKLSEAGAIEDELSELLKTSRGYGVAFPDLESKPIFLIENATTGLVIEPVSKPGEISELGLGTKIGRKKPSQCWRLEREEKGFVIRNVESKDTLHAFAMRPGVVIGAWGGDPEKQSDKRAYFRITEIHREIVIESVQVALVLTATERKTKGVTTTYLTQEKKEATPSPAQLWTLIEAK